MAEKPTPDIDRTAATANDDPIVTKSLAPHYVVAIVVLMATLFWALWDESFGQRPWKSFQSEWKDRYTLFLKAAHSNSVSRWSRNSRTSLGLRLASRPYFSQLHTISSGFKDGA